MTKIINKLNCMNYQVNAYNVGYYYICDGLRGLYDLSKKYDVRFKSMVLTLLQNGYVELDNQATDSIDTVTMI